MSASRDVSPTVFVVDDEASIRKALRSMLEAAGFTVETFESANEFLAGFDRGRCGCAILDVRMPGMSGLDLQSYLVDHGIVIPVIILTGHGDIPMAVQAMQSGAVTFLEKPAQADVLIETVRKAIDTDRESRQQSSEVDEIREGLASLTPRELQVLEMLADGKTPKTIAFALGTQEGTVRVQRANIRKKMNADSVGDLIRMFLTARDDS